MSLVTTETNPETGEQRRRVNLGREPKQRYRELDGRNKRFFITSLVTMVAIAILCVYLLPFLYMLMTSVKTEEQLAQGTILPKSMLHRAIFSLARVGSGRGPTHTRRSTKRRQVAEPGRFSTPAVAPAPGACGRPPQTLECAPRRGRPAGHPFPFPAPPGAFLERRFRLAPPYHRQTQSPARARPMGRGGRQAHPA